MTRSKDSVDVRRRKRALTRAMAAQRDVSAKWNRLSGGPHYDGVKNFVEEENASVEVRRAAVALREAGVDPRVDDRLYHTRFPMWPGHVEQMFAEARRRRLSVTPA